MIKFPLPAKAQYQLNTLTTNSPSTFLDLKIGKQLDADIIQIAPDKKSIQLTIAQKKITAFINIESQKSKQQLAQLKTGDTIKLIVSKLHPQTELKILRDHPTNNSPKNTAYASAIHNKNLTFILKPTTLLTSTVQNNKPILPPPASLLLQTPKNTKYAPLLVKLNKLQQLNANIIQVYAKKITVQLLIPVKLDVITNSKPTSRPQVKPDAITNTEPTKTTPVKPNVITNSKPTSHLPVKSDAITNTEPTKTTPVKADVITNSKPTSRPQVKPDAITNTEPTKTTPVKADVITNSKPTNRPQVQPDIITNTKSSKTTPVKPNVIADSKPTSHPQIQPDIIANTKLTNLSQPSKLSTSLIKPSQLNTPSPVPTAQTTYQALILNFPLSTKNVLSQQLTLSPQQAITLQVIKTGAEPQFKILPPPTIEETINTALREFLPKELPPPTLLQQLSRDLPAIVRNEQVSETLKRLAQEILKSLPSKQQITEGKHLKSALNNNGIFLEAKLSQTFTDPNTPKLNTDFKANLLKLMQTLQQNPTAKGGDTSDNETMTTLLKEIQTKTEGTLARLMLNQLKSLPQEDPNKQVWIIDLPFTDKKEKATSVKIQIEENHKKTDDPEQKSWSATLTLTPPNMQTLHCKISYLNQAVHTNFWSEHTKTTQLIQNNLDYLSQRLDQAGLTPGNMSASQQKPSRQRSANLDTKPLFDDNA